MAKTKIKFNSTNKKRKKGIEEQGALLDPLKLNIKTKTIEVSKEDLYAEMARDWHLATQWGERLTDKRRARVLEKVLTAGVFEDELIPLKSGNEEELMYYMALVKARDTALYIQNIVYDEMVASGEIAAEPDDAIDPA